MVNEDTIAHFFTTPNL